VETGLEGAGVVVTGASGGIGAACARAFAAEGARVVVHYNRGEERARAVADELDGARVAQADLTREDDVERLFAEARDALGRVDVCAAVAGVYPRDDAPVWELGLDRFEETIAQNLTATFLTARAFLRGLGGSGPGSLVLVGSTAGRFGEAGHADYAAAKAAIQGGLLLSLKNEAARLGSGVRVNAVAPGWTVSPMTRGLLTDEDVRRITRTMPLRKVATPGGRGGAGRRARERSPLRSRQRRARDNRRRDGGPRPPRPLVPRYSLPMFLPMQIAPPGRELTAINSMAVEWRAGRRWPPLSVSEAPPEG
jgi:3-oxoacyl-[acyl-carrier protein] reductase